MDQKPTIGRPTKFTEDRKEKILNAITLGATYKLACLYGGVTYETFREWLRQAAADEKEGATTPYTLFSDAVKEAEGIAVIGWLAKIEDAANDGNWTAAAWKMERRYPNEYGKESRENPDQRPTFIINVNEKTPEEIRDLMHGLREPDHPDAEEYPGEEHPGDDQSTGDQTT